MLWPLLAPLSEFILYVNWIQESLAPRIISKTNARMQVQMKCLENILVLLKNTWILLFLYSKFAFE